LQLQKQYRKLEVLQPTTHKSIKGSGEGGMESPNFDIALPFCVNGYKKESIRLYNKNWTKVIGRLGKMFTGRHILEEN